MCRDAMDVRPKHMKALCPRKTTKPGSKSGWRPLRVEDEALRLCRARAAMAAVRKHLRREQRRAQLAKLATIIGDVDRKEQRKAMFKESTDAARRTPGAMAPENTTQYLMSNVYEDMKANQVAPVTYEASAHLYTDCLSPRTVYSALDCGYDGCLAFQQRDFEEAFGLQ